jgi:hypothetical protein
MARERLEPFLSPPYRVPLASPVRWLTKTSEERPRASPIGIYPCRSTSANGPCPQVISPYGAKCLSITDQT